MKKEFSKKWKGSSQPRKQRKYLAKAPLNKKRKLLSVNLSKNLRNKIKKRNIPAKKGDKVKILRGKYKGKEGKITKILTKQTKIYIENIQTKKQDGSSVEIPLRPSNLQIIELNMEDKKRFKTETPKKETSPVKMENKK